MGYPGGLLSPTSQKREVGHPELWSSGFLGAAQGGRALEVGEGLPPEDTEREATATGEAAEKFAEEQARAPLGDPEEGLAEGAEVAMALQDEREEGGFAAAVGAELADERGQVVAVGVADGGFGQVLDAVAGAEEKVEAVEVLVGPGGRAGAE